MTYNHKLVIIEVDEKNIKSGKNQCNTIKNEGFFLKMSFLNHIVFNVAFKNNLK